MRIIITGGAGYLGSFSILKAIAAGHELLILDNFSNSVPTILDRVQRLMPCVFEVKKLDVLDYTALNAAFSKFNPDLVIHLAALKATIDSVQQPIEYYENSIAGLLNILKAMSGSNCQKIIFSSSAAIFGEPIELPITEGHPKLPRSPYARVKLMCEQILQDWSNASNSNTSIILRYFNIAGAEPSGFLGEMSGHDPSGLIPMLVKNAAKNIPVNIFGNRYATEDGYAVRDFVHVMDAAAAILAAVDFTNRNDGYFDFNIGSGKPSSVNDVINTFIRVSKVEPKIQIALKRQGEISSSWSNPEKALDLLGWQAAYNLEDICNSAWIWEQSFQT